MATSSPHLFDTSPETSHQLFVKALESGEKRAAYLDKSGKWQVDKSVKEGILTLFAKGQNTTFNNWPGFVDKHNLLPRAFTQSDGVRMVPGGSSVRRGAHIGKNVIIMPPSYINIGSYVDDGSMVDSHVLVGSCAQIGKNVHLSAGVQIGGVLEPINAHPVIIEDNVFVGASTIIVEGMLVKKNAVLAPNLTLSPSIEIYDLVKEEMLPKGSPIPENAVVIPGSRPVTSGWGKEHRLHKACLLIVKYRDAKTNAATALESVLR